MTAEVVDDYYRLVVAPRNRHIRAVFALSMERKQRVDKWALYRQLTALAQEAGTIAATAVEQFEPVLDLTGRNLPELLDEELIPNTARMRALPGSLSDVRAVPFFDDNGGMLHGCKTSIQYFGPLKNLLKTARRFAAMPAIEETLQRLVQEASPVLVS